LLLLVLKLAHFTGQAVQHARAISVRSGVACGANGLTLGILTLAKLALVAIGIQTNLGRIPPFVAQITAD